VLQRIYIGRRFKNDPERLEKLFETYTKMTTGQKAEPAKKVARGKSVSKPKSVVAVMPTSHYAPLLGDVKQGIRHARAWMAVNDEIICL
jgi:predicted Holliday junction resolvase-like endonuclease